MLFNQLKPLCFFFLRKASMIIIQWKVFTAGKLSHLMVSDHSDQDTRLCLLLENIPLLIVSLFLLYYDHLAVAFCHSLGCVGSHINRQNKGCLCYTLRTHGATPAWCLRSSWKMEMNYCWCSSIYSHSSLFSLQPPQLQSSSLSWTLQLSVMCQLQQTKWRSAD